MDLQVSEDNASFRVAFDKLKIPQNQAHLNVTVELTVGDEVSQESGLYDNYIALFDV